MEKAFDVAIVGYGPAGEVLASTIGAAGFNVVVLERWPSPYPLPRLTTLDGECCRVVQATSADADKGFTESCVQEMAHFVDAVGDALMVVRYPGKIGGWPSRMSVFQPDFERGIADKVDGMPNVEVLRGWEVFGIEQDDESVTLTAAPFDEASMTRVDTDSQKFRVQYVIGADGTRSFVRDAAGLTMRDLDLHERWLNFDAELKRPLPEKFERLNIYMDPARPHMHMPIGKRYLRLEFRVMENETDEEVTNPDVAWDFLTRKHGIGPDDVSIMRQVVYHYHTRIADQWRDRRIFIAGDAAHTMPPYMGQGGCAAVRDARNLGWKLVEVLARRSDPVLLDTYQEERKPHVTTLVLASDMLSRTVNIVDPDEAERRNVGMRKNADRTPPDLPSLEAGVLFHLADGVRHPLAGRMTPQGLLRRDGRTMRGDDLLGSGFQLWCRTDPDAQLGDAERGWLEEHSVGIAVFEDPESRHAVEDVDGVYTAFLREHGADIILVRPDFYAFGGGSGDQVNMIVRDLARQLISDCAAAPRDLAEQA
ncbi:MAG TPA: bifunctional 3-(3-hydroxy-phenyl)propionate/3-hydroxycinnamic acid hydroxylase [Sphingomonas sp.]|nr:bifunctional 3-(3-hydroxy-phenyl)propionate/3-hydroxycinnamic acid hydroxylase [Sphingomonas sp.]